jgi:hypothetical protein
VYNPYGKAYPGVGQLAPKAITAVMLSECHVNLRQLHREAESAPPSPAQWGPERARLSRGLLSSCRQKDAQPST